MKLTKEEILKRAEDYIEFMRKEINENKYCFVECNKKAISDLEELLKIDMKYNLIKTCRFEDGVIVLFLKTREFKDGLDNNYYEYLQIDKASRMISDYIDCPVREMYWETNRLKLDQIPFEIRDFVKN